MAYFIVVGTDNNVKSVVDEVRESHLQHNVVTSGCIISKENRLFYNWDVYNAQGNKNNEGGNNVTSLRDALTNQIAQFKTLLPEGAVPNVFVIGSCYTAEDAERLKYVYDELCDIGGATLSGLMIDIVLLGYNLTQCQDVTIRSDWQTLKLFQGIENGRFKTDVLYINNMDYDGAATNVDAKLLGRFLSHWSKMVSCGGTNPKTSVQNGHYAIGLAERQYNFDDLTPFFKLAAEERILDRMLHDTPAKPTQEMLDHKYFRDIELERPWIDGLCHIKETWNSYCAYEFDYNRPVEEQPYALSVQKQKLALYLNDWLKIYCMQQQADITALEAELVEIEAEIAALTQDVAKAQTTDEETGEIIESAGAAELKQQLADKERKQAEQKRQIAIHRKNIEANSFADSRTIQADLQTHLLTDSQREQYARDTKSEEALLDYLHTDAAFETINQTIVRAVHEEYAGIPVFPKEIQDNVGRLEELKQITTTSSTPIASTTATTDAEQRSGCIGWWAKLFHKTKANEPAVVISEEELAAQKAQEQAEQCEILQKQITAAFVEYRKTKEVETWWNKLCCMIDEKDARQKQCKQEMDGEIEERGNHKIREGGYTLPFHRKSISLIEVDKAREYRDTAPYYLEQIDKLKARYFNADIPEGERQTMQELIKHQVIDALRGMWHTLKWDGTNPFCNELLTDTDIHNFIEDSENGTHKQSKPFVEYVGLETKNISQHILYLFYFNHPQIQTQPNLFRDTYHVSEQTLSPVFLLDFVNSLCEVQILNISEYVSQIGDFKPKTMAVVHESKIDYREFVSEIVGDASSVMDKAKAIYKWLCDNIAYDTTYQIHDADKCWETKRGVCQAYCELFYHLGKAVGLTVEIITGKSKTPEDKISDKGHAWVFVYTNGYEGIFIDPTWGAGVVNKGVFTHTADNWTWFDIDPDWLIFTHYAENEEWNKSSAIVTEEQFNKLPFVEPQTTKGQERLFEELAKVVK